MQAERPEQRKENITFLECNQPGRRVRSSTFVDPSRVCASTLSHDMKGMRRYINPDEMRIQVEGHRVAWEAIHKLGNVAEDGHDRAFERTVRLHGLDDGGGVLLVVVDQVKHGVVKRLGL